MSRRERGGQRADLVYYITGHGFGHATRSIEILREVERLLPGIAIHVRTAAPDWLFRRDLPAVVVSEADVDLGIVQRDGLVFRPQETLRGLDAFLGALPSLAANEKAVLKSLAPRLVVSDVSPFPMEWARDLGIPGVVVGNFGWDAIYRDFARRVPAFHPFADRFERGYDAAKAILRLPFAIREGAFARGDDLPLVARRPVRDPAAVRRGLRPGGRPVILVSFGGFPVREVPLGAMARLSQWLFVFPNGGAGRPLRSSNLRWLQPDKVDHAALVEACDLVIGKPGYGLVSEVIAAGARMLYTSRGRFPEYPVLTRALRRTGRARHLPRRELREGRIAERIRAVMELPEGSAETRWQEAVGGLVAARRLLALMAPGSEKMRR